MSASYISSINSPYIGNKTIMHSTLGTCSQSLDIDSVKIVDDSFVLGEELAEGLTINVYFANKNTIFNNNLQLSFKSSTSSSRINIPIISSVIYGGNAPDPEHQIEGNEAYFMYPQWEDRAIVTFVYKITPVQTEVSEGVWDSINKPVQQAINAQPVQTIIVTQEQPTILPEEPNQKLDFNNWIKPGIVEIYDINKMTGNKMPDITSQTGGILEIIPIRDSLLIQRVTTNDGYVYQREMSEQENPETHNPELHWCDWTKMAILPQDAPYFIATPENIIVRSLPTRPTAPGSHVTYNVILNATDTGYEFTFTPTSSGS